MPETGPQPPDAGPAVPEPTAKPKREGATFDLAMARSLLAITEKQQAENPQAYAEAKTKYEAERATYVAGNVERMLDERERVVEAEAIANPRKVGFIEKAWRGWGEVSLIPQSWRDSFEKTAFGKTRVGRAFIRSLNMRTALSLSLWGLAAWSGFGGVVGIGSLIARSGMGMAGTYFGSQAFMEGLAQKHRFTLDEKRLKTAVEFDINDTAPAALDARAEHKRYLEDELARLEAASLLAGRKVDDSPEYQRVREAYSRFAEAEMNAPDEETHPEVPAEKVAHVRMEEIFKRLDSQARERERGYRMGAIGRKVVAAALAGLFPSARLLALLGNEEELLKLGRSFETTTPRAPAAPEAPRGGMTLPAAPERAPDATLGGGVKLSPEATERIQEVIGGKPQTAEALTAVEQGLGPVMAIEQGGNVWRSAMRLVETRQMSRPQFEKAWANSYVEIAGQGKVPISKVGLVHAGDIVRFNREAGVFEVISKSNMPVGSDKDLFAAYERLGKEAPEWLKKSVGVPLRPDEVLAAGDQLRGLSPAEVDELARVDEFEKDMAAQAEARGIARAHEEAEGIIRSPGEAEALVKIGKSI